LKEENLSWIICDSDLRKLCCGEVILCFAEEAWFWIQGILICKAQIFPKLSIFFHFAPLAGREKG
jgi:hypothetical protein